MHSKDHDMDRLLRDAYARLRTQPSAMPAAPPRDEYYLIGRVLEGSATEAERATLAQRAAADPDIAAILQHAAAVRQPPPHRVRIWQSAAWLLRGAACLLLAVSLYFVTAHFTARRMAPLPYPAPDAGRTPLLQLRGAPTNAAPVTNRLSHATPALPAPIVIQTRCMELSNSVLRDLVLYDASYAVAVGIDDYDPARTGFAPLHCAAADAKLLTAKLDEFRMSGTTLLLNSNATRQAILTALQRAITQAGRNGAVLLYFAGHGYRHADGEREAGFLIPWDGSLQRADLFARNIQLTEIKRLARQHGVKHFYIVLDACYSGLICFRGATDFGMQAPDFFYLKELSLKPVIQVLAAAGRDTPTVDGLFTKAFVAALDRGKSRGFVTAREIDRYVSKQVTQQARRTYAFEQTPVAGKLEPSLGEYVFVSKTQAPVTYAEPGLACVASYRLPVALNMKITCADINDDGKPEFVGVNSNTVTVFDRAGATIATRRFDAPIALSMVKDTDGDGFAEISVSYKDATNIYAAVLDPWLHDLRQFTRPGSLKGNFSELALFDVRDINGDFAREAICFVHTGYAGTPRGVSVFDYDSGRLLWHRETVASAPPLETVMFDHDRGSPDLLMLLGSQAVNNLTKGPDGLDDMHSYVWLLDAQGRPRWRKTCGGPYTSAYTSFVDLDRNGVNEVLIYLRTNYEYVEHDVGTLMLLDQNGHRLRTYPSKYSVQSICIAPNYTEHTMDMLVAFRNGTVVQLDPELRQKRILTFPCPPGRSPTPAIKGMLSTRYGDFIALLYYEEDRLVKHPSGDTHRNLTDIWNARLQLLDRQTLASRHTVALETANPARFHNATYPIQVRTADIDIDGEDELIVARTDRVDIYKLRLPDAAE